MSSFDPWQLAKSGTEHGEQAAFFAWCGRARWVGAMGCMHQTQWSDPLIAALLKANAADNAPYIPELEWLHAIPNGGERGKASAGNMKAEGVKSGVADMFWPVAVGKFHGLYIEMKRRTGRPSDLSQRQLDFREFVLAKGYAWCWTPGWLVARDRIIAYATGKWEGSFSDV